MNAVGFTATKTPAKTLLRNVKAAAQKALMTRFELALTSSFVLAAWGRKNSGHDSTSTNDQPDALP
jgi:hypothetical protein